MIRVERRNRSKSGGRYKGTLIPRISPQGNALGGKERINDRIIGKTVQRGNLRSRVIIEAYSKFLSMRDVTASPINSHQLCYGFTDLQEVQMN